MPAPDYELPAAATPGEWKAALAPLLGTVDSAGEVAGYVVIALTTGGLAELRTNLGDDGLRTVLLTVMPEDAHA